MGRHGGEEGWPGRCKKVRLSIVSTSSYEEDVLYNTDLPLYELVYHSTKRGGERDDDESRERSLPRLDESMMRERTIKKVRRDGRRRNTKVSSIQKYWPPYPAK